MSDGTGWRLPNWDSGCLDHVVECNVILSFGNRYSYSYAYAYAYSYSYSYSYAYYYYYYYYHYHYYYYYDQLLATTSNY